MAANTDNAGALAPATTYLALDASTQERLMEQAKQKAELLATIITERELFIDIGRGRHVFCEGWTALGAMMGVAPYEVENYPDALGVYTAVIELRRIDTGQAITRASAECGAPDEFDHENNLTWAERPAYARRSMAATRATGKACRLAFSWIMVLAGFHQTPAEEMQAVAPTPFGERKPPPGPTARPITPKQVARFYAIARQHNYGKAEAEDYVIRTYGTPVEQLDRRHYDEVCDLMQSQPAPNPTRGNAGLRERL